MKRRGRGEGTVMLRSPGVYRLRAYAGSDPVTGKPRQVSRTVKAPNKTAALRELRAFLADVETGNVPKVIGGKATLRSLLDAWIPLRRAQTTRETYRTVADNHLIPALGKIELRRLSAHDLDSYYAAKLAEPMAPATVRQHHSILSGALSQAVKWDWIDRNPAAKATPPNIPRTKKFIPEVEQVRALIEAAGDDLELATAVVLASITGARRGELCGLRWSDVDWAEGVLHVERQRVPVKGGDMTAPLKYGDGRPVAVGELGLEVLRRYRRAVADRAEERGPVDPDGWLLSDDGGHSPLAAKWLGESITALGKKTGIPVTTHAFRRFAATQMVGAGVDVRTAAGRLGHTPEVLLRVYAGFLPSRDVAAAKMLEAGVLSQKSDDL